MEVLLVQLVDKPLVLTKACQRVCPRRLRRHGGNRPLPQIGVDVREPVQGYSPGLAARAEGPVPPRTILSGPRKEVTRASSIRVVQRLLLFGINTGG
ncbi:unnamed protein product [[Actinomadura] parvosata subsp. kistnae]|nr:unnamed protein product [Actinomadura parvosata subsp. kistnae]